MSIKPNVKRKKAETIKASDFWCGGGGTSTGLKQAAEELGVKVELTAVNHWSVAVATHTANHPDARHYCKAVDTLKPQEVFPDGVIDLFLASPECTHHSNARGGKPRDEQSRADANDIKRWAEKLFIKKGLLENVKEFIDWGPLDPVTKKPIQRLKGKYFLNFINFLKLTHRVEWRILNCADYGDATTRERFFLQFIHKSLKKKIVWAEPTHAPRSYFEKQETQPLLINNPKTMKPWRPAREIIDWSIKGESIFLTPEDVKERGLKIKRPLSMNTMKRIVAGLFKYSLKPFLLNNKGTDRRDGSLDNPTFTQCAGGNHQYLIDLEAFLLQHFGEREGQDPRIKNLNEPLWTVTAQGRMGIAEPFIASLANTGDGKEPRVYEMDRPLVTLTAKNFLGLLTPYLVKYHSGENGGIDRSYSVDEPLQTLDTSNRFGIVTPFITRANGEKGGKVDRHTVSIENPLPTIVATWNKLGIVETVPFLTKYHGNEKEAQSVDDPLSTLTTKDRLGIVEPFLVRMKANQDGQNIDDPVKTLTTKESYALVIPQLGIALDILFRMLQPHELAAAMSFPKSYSFAGTRADQVKQIGNAVPVNTAKALIKTLLEN